MRDSRNTTSKTEISAPQNRFTKTQREEIEKLGVKLYDNFYLEEPLDNGSTMRIFKNREEINKVCLMDGELPATTGEIAIDRMYADNNGLSVGDILQSGKKILEDYRSGGSF